jgi:signal transduction histidine kinase
MKNLHQLGTALLDEHDTILQRWRTQVRTLDSAKHLDTPTLNDHIPGWLRTFAGKLLAFGQAEAPAAATGPAAHGVQRFDDGFDIEEVVGEYNILRDCVYEFAEGHGLELRGESRRVVDRVFDESTGLAVKSFAESQAHQVERRRVEHLAFVVHDLRTPLSAITYATAILERRLPAETRDADTARLLKTLARNARQLDALVTHVLQENTQLLTELGVKVERRTFDFWPVVETLLQDLQALADKSATRLVNVVPDELELTADATLVRRILQNLVTNALEYAPGGEVTIGARDPGGGQPVECWVSDNGAGIPASRIDAVFRPLETDPERDGIGLGLAIVKTFVEAHHGTVTVESVEGRGATFRFTLPRTAPALVTATAVPA